MLEKLENFLNNWRVNNGEKDFYYHYIYDEQQDIEFEFDTELDNLLKKEGITEYDFVYVGGFESPRI